jgi:hypothetical protein
MYGSVSMLARALGRRREQVSKWHTNGVPIMSADNLAISLGMHPIEVWPDWYEIEVPGAA